MTTPYFRFLRLAAIITMAVGPPVAMAQTFSPYSDFLNMTQSQLATLQAKLTYGGIQEEPIATIVITGPSATVQISQFDPFKHTGFSYVNDGLPVRRITASVAELQAILQNANAIPAVQSGAVENPPYVSFALFNTIGGTAKGFEAILNPTDGIALLNAIQAAFQSDLAGLATIGDFSCATALVDPTAPTDVSGTVAITLSGIRLNRTTGRFVGTATLQNNGSSLLTPISLVLTLPQGVTLFNAGGTTCNVPPVGRPFINASTGAQFAAGASVQVPLEFVNPNNVPITIASSVLSGPGGR
jgi:hypothetical protein